MRGGVTILFILILIFIPILIFILLYLKEIKTLNSLKKIDDYPLYQMNYYNDYYFELFLKTGAKNNKDIEKYVKKMLFKVKIKSHLGGCSAFVSKNNLNEVIYGRNFDWDYAPILQIKTTPKNGYSSISTIDLAYLGFNKNKKPSKFSAILLAAPYLTFDGMNDQGLAVSFLSVPNALPELNPDKTSLTNTTTLRLLLDNAKNVEEALLLLNNFNMSFEDGVLNHLLIGDVHGNSVIVEYLDNKLRICKSNEDYQVATNFIVYDELMEKEEEPLMRFNIIKNFIKSKQISNEEAFKILYESSMHEKSHPNGWVTQWSVLYNLTTLESHIFVNRNIQNIYKFNLGEEK